MSMAGRSQVAELRYGLKERGRPIPANWLMAPAHFPIEAIAPVMRADVEEDAMTNSATTKLLHPLRIELPIHQAPMAGVSSPAIVAAVSEAGGLGAIGVGAAGVECARQMTAGALTGTLALEM